MVAVEQFLKFLPTIQQMPEKNLWLAYDSEADVLYIHFKEPNQADDSELTDDDIIIRYAGDDIIGYTILHASKRN
jgi:uncharacterized protein YuzE